VNVIVGDVVANVFGVVGVVFAATVAAFVL